MRQQPVEAFHETRLKFPELGIDGVKPRIDKPRIDSVKPRVNCTKLRVPVLP